MKLHKLMPPIPAGAVYEPELAERAVGFFPAYLRHTKGRWAGHPFELEPFQEYGIIRPLFGYVNAETGLRWYREALVGLARKNGKSEVAAGLALYLLTADGEAGAEVYSLAGDRKQASLVFNTAAQMIRANPLLRALARPYRNVIDVQESGSVYRALSADADLQHGLNPSGAIVDEYHVHKNSEQYEAMRTGTAAREQPLIVTISTAGEQRGSGPLWELYQRALSGADPRVLLFWQGAGEDDDATDPKVWRAANPASWISDEFLADQHRSLPGPVFERLHLNRWPKLSAQRWVSADVWSSGDSPPELAPELPCVVAIDAAPRRDKTAVVLDQIGPDGVHNIKCWTFQADENVGFLDYGIIEDLLRNLATDYNVARMAFDPYGMQRTLTDLEAEGLPVESYPQTHDRMVPASMNLHALVVEKRIRHGADPELSRAVLNSAVREVAGGWRLSKVPGESNDAAIALAIATRLADLEAGNSGGPVVMVV